MRCKQAGTWFHQGVTWRLVIGLSVTVVIPVPGEVRDVGVAPGNSLVDGNLAASDEHAADVRALDCDVVARAGLWNCRSKIWRYWL